MKHGFIIDIWTGTISGRYHYDRATGTYTFKWLKVVYKGYTEEGLQRWADSLDYCLQEI